MIVFLFATIKFNTSGPFWFLLANVLIFTQAVSISAPLQNRHQQATQTAGDSTAAVQGAITDSNGAPLYLVNVAIKGTMDGGVTNKTGRFHFSTRALGSQTLRISLVGFQTVEKAIHLSAGQTAQISVRLESRALELNDMQVVGSSFTTGDGKGVTLNELEVVTTPGAAADIFRAIQFFPGVSGLDEGAGLLVRGGDVSEVKVILDQATVVHPFRYENPSGGVFGSISPFLVSGTFFSSGGFSARYGDALSGVLAMESQDMPDQLTIKTTASFAATSAGLDIPVSDKLGIRFSGNRSFTEFLFNINGISDDFEQSPEGYDGNLSLIYKPRPGTQFKLFNFANKNRVGVRVPQATFNGTFKNEEYNRLHNLQWTELMGRWLLEMSASWNSYSTDRSFGGLLLTQTDDALKWRSDVAYNWNRRLQLQMGGEVEYRSNQFRGTIPEDDEVVDPRGDFMDINEQVGATRLGAWSELAVKVLPKTTLTMGQRSDYWSIDDQWIADPRLNLHYKSDTYSSFGLAIGRYRQFPEPFEFNSKTGNPNLKAQQAWHYIASAEYKKDLIHLRGEVFYKKYDHLVIEDEFSNVSNRGYGFASGVDLFAKYSEFLTTRFNGWISYSYLRSKRYQPRQLARGLAYEFTPSDFALTHNLSVVGKYRVWKMLTVGATYRIITGRPFTPVMDAVFDDARGFYRPVEGSVNSKRFPPFKRLDVDLSYFWQFSRNHSVIFFMSITNALNRDNITDVTYNENYSERRFIRSNFERSLFLGATLNLAL